MKNTVEWMDIIKIKGGYYLEKFNVEFEDSRLNDIKLSDNEAEILEKLEELEKTLDDFVSEPLYDCSKFYEALQLKYGLSDDELEEVETYLFDNIDLPNEVYKTYDIAWLGGYVNGVNI